MRGWKYLTSPSRRQREEIVKPPLWWLGWGAALGAGALLVLEYLVGRTLAGTW